jgi:hypothetical protein
MEFWLSGAFHTEFFFFDDGILAIREPFSRTFSFFTIELWLSGSLSHKLFLFSRWNFGYQGAFLMNFSFSWWNFGYHGAFSQIFLSHGGILAIIEPFHEFFFHMMEFTKCTIWGKILSIYITKSIYIGSASLKTLSLDLEPPLQGKEYGPPYSNVIAKKKAKIFSPKSLIDL